MAMVALTLTTAVGVTLAPAASATTSAIDEAQSVRMSVREFRTSVLAELERNLDDYGDRLSHAERTRVTTIVGEVDRDLGRLQSTTAQASRLVTQGAPLKAQRSAAHRASVTFDAGYTKALTRLAEMQPILQPRLSLIEGLQAKLDLDEQMGRYELLGQRIHGLEDHLRT